MRQPRDPRLPLIELVAVVVPVRHVPLVLPRVLVHARPVLVVLLAVPLVAVLALVPVRELPLQVLRRHIPQNGSSFLLIAPISSRVARSSGFSGWGPRGRRGPPAGGPARPRPSVLPSPRMSGSPGRRRPARTRTPKIAGLLARNTNSGRNRTFAGYGIARRRAAPGSWRPPAAPPPESWRRGE